MVEIRDKEEFKLWLEANGQEWWAPVLAARAALRVIPLIAVDKRVQRTRKWRQDIFWPLNRALIVSAVASKFPTAETRVAAAAAAVSFAAVSAVYFGADAAAAVSFAADAAAAFAAAAAAAADAVSFAAAAATSFAADGALVWQAISQDCSALEVGQSLQANALWPNDAPGWVSEAIDDMNDVLLADGPHWQVFVDWYRDRLDGDAAAARRGRPAIKEMEIEIATIPDEVWKAGPERALGRIKEIQEKYWRSPSKSSTLLTDFLQSASYGAQVSVRASETYLHVHFGGGQSDSDVALRSDVRDRVLRLHGRLIALQGSIAGEDHPDWADLLGSVDALCQIASQGAQGLVDRLIEAWELSVTLGDFIEMNIEIKANRSLTNTPPLSAGVERQLRSLNSLLGPLLREFPSARKMDDEHRAWNERKEDIPLAQGMLARLDRHDLLINRVVELLELALKERSGTGNAAEKLRSTGIGTVRKLAVAAVYAATIAISGGFSAEMGVLAADESIVAKKAADLIAEGADDIFMLLSSAPADIRQAVLDVVEQIRGEERNLEDRMERARR